MVDKIFDITWIPLTFNASQFIGVSYCPGKFSKDRGSSGQLSTDLKSLQSQKIDSCSMKEICLDILKPDDWHVHLREGKILSNVLPFTYDNFGSALVMPNLDNPITNISLAKTYYNEICRQIPKGIKFDLNITNLSLIHI